VRQINLELLQLRCEALGAARIDIRFLHGSEFLQELRQVLTGKAIAVRTIVALE
jgi:hypothetical protein